ncbi:TPA: hypothetical protein EYP70_03190 [Candidatus Bathyarchaeota archaeon]|nr:hypothetical protein [Candidatus Bathyarchaeota archaeon]
MLGSAGQLDSARFRRVLSEKLNVPVSEVEGYVIGEHGEHMVPLFSRVKVKGNDVQFKPEEQKEILEELRKTAINVISKKGATIYAPACNTADIVQAILHDEKKLFVCSAVLNGEYNLRDISIGVPVLIGRGGAEKIIEWELSSDEMLSLERGALRLKSILSSLR